MARTRPALPPMTRGRREHRKHLTRQELLAAGRRLFGEQGLYESRIEDLTRHAGIAKGTIYGYFANKQELMEAVVTAGFSELLGEVDRATHGATNTRERLGLCVQAHFDFFDTNPTSCACSTRSEDFSSSISPTAVPCAACSRTISPASAARLRRSSAPAADRSGITGAGDGAGAVSGVASTHAALTACPERGAIPRAAQAITEMVLQHANLRGAPAYAARRTASTSAPQAPLTGAARTRVRPPRATRTTRRRLST
ncbi:MAG: TetR/AcrR family transcriptional regulator [Candidatus Eisenbacteria bacterium]|nr:TetR/AcrR family transcriptional regulator [Candidatus Eisenbacteria bacterium]